MKIDGRVFLVTGGVSGLGEAVTRLLLANGGSVCAVDLSEERGKALTEEFAQQAFLFHRVDVSSEEHVRAALDATVSRFGGLHGVVQCAGVGPPKKVLSKRGVHDLKSFEFVLRVNLVGTFNVLRLAAEVMSKQPRLNEDERGVFVHVASVAAFEGQIGQAAYSASKGGVVAMTLPLARELSRIGIRVVTVAPGIFDTPMLAKLPEKVRRSLAQQVPVQKLGAPEEFAQLCKSIINNQYLSGCVIRLDGGLRMSAM